MFLKVQENRVIEFSCKIRTKVGSNPKTKIQNRQNEIFGDGNGIGRSTQESCRRTRMLRSGLTLQPRPIAFVCETVDRYIHSPTPRN